VSLKSRQTVAIVAGHLREDSLDFMQEGSEVSIISRDPSPEVITIVKEEEAMLVQMAPHKFLGTAFEKELVISFFPEGSGSPESTVV
jgi:hypothetical protein